MKSLYLAVCLTLPLGTALAEPAAPSNPPVIEATSLTDDQLREAIAGKTIYLSISGIELPIHYKPNGRMTGSIGRVTAAFSRAVMARVIVGAGGSKQTSFVSDGRVGWMEKPTATRSPVKATS